MSKGTSIVGFVLSFVAGMILMWGIDRGAGPAPTAKAEGAAGMVDGVKSANAGAVPVELYVMSQCPYGVQAENGFKEVVEKFGADIDFKVHFIGQGSAETELTSMHGPNEVKGDMVQACAMKYSPKWFDLILCQNKAMKEVATNWEACAREVGAPADKLAECVNGPEGKQLLAASFKKAQEKGARGSPTIYIGGQQYQGGRRPADFMKAICGAYQGNKPAACSDIPESPKVNVTILSDKRCAECDTKRYEGQVRSKVANPVMKTLDYSDAEGKKLFDAIKPANLPAIVFDGTLDADKEAAQAFGRGLRQAGDYKVMGAGQWNPACADEGGCNLDECKPTLQCRPEEPNKLEVFVMSQCPFGVKGLNAMEEVLANFKKNDAKLDFQVHFIGNGDAKAGLTSMHGQGEVDEDIREACAIEHYGKDFKFMDYVLCRNKNIKDANWQSCTGGTTGIDTAKMDSCFSGDEGKGLLEKSFKYSQASGMSASPTWLVNGKYKFSGIDAETIKTNVCKYNKLAGCDAKLTGQAPPPAGGQAPAAPGCGG
jgi:predicted DsbA family dithiol-disulfide isomerase